MISVIIPVYNVATYLDECIQSIISQTFQDFEIILINDGSSDQSGDICDLWASKDKRIKVIHQENSGLSMARNKGFDLASGEFIAFVDSDDIIHPQMFEILYNAIILNNADFSACHEFAFEDGFTPDTNSLFDLKKQPITYIIEDHSQFMLHFLKPFRGELTWVWNKLFKREFIGNLRFQEIRILEDVLFICELSQKVHTCVWCEEKLYYYRQHNASIMHKKNHDFYKDSLYAIHFEYNYMKNETDTIFKYKHDLKCLSMLHYLYKNSRSTEDTPYLSSILEEYVSIYNNIKKQLSLKDSKYHLFYIEMMYTFHFKK